MLPQVRLLPREPGVYRFRDTRGRVLYLGRATDLRARVASYWSELRGRRHLVRMVRQITGLEAAVCANVHEAAWLERNLLEQSLPRFNRVRGGQEVPVWLRLDDTPAAPGLRVVHLGLPGDAGPFLGGRQARLAVSGLLRVHPLGYAGTRATGAEREMAAMRGVGPADRERLVAEIRATLRGGGTTAGLLAAERDRSAAALAFEHAAVVQAEIEALAWVCSPQRVTVAGGGDSRVTAWSDGVEVTFGVRQGSVRTWAVQRRTRPADPGPPPAWAAFAQRNADLAAALMSR